MIKVKQHKWFKIVSFPVKWGKSACPPRASCFWAPSVEIWWDGGAMLRGFLIIPNRLAYVASSAVGSRTRPPSNP